MGTGAREGKGDGHRGHGARARHREPPARGRRPRLVDPRLDARHERAQRQRGLGAATRIPGREREGGEARREVARALHASLDVSLRALPRARVEDLRGQERGPLPPAP